jgi:hypothetical protein
LQPIHNQTLGQKDPALAFFHSNWQLPVLQGFTLLRGLIIPQPCVHHKHASRVPLPQGVLIVSVVNSVETLKDDGYHWPPELDFELVEPNRIELAMTTFATQKLKQEVADVKCTVLVFEQKFAPEKCNWDSRLSLGAHPDMRVANSIPFG